MNPDELKEAWKMQALQGGFAGDAEQLLQEVQRKQQAFDSTILLRDIREVGVALLMVPVWLVMGLRMSLPWTWYLTVPGLLWIAGFMLADRRRYRRRVPELGEPLRQHVLGSLAQVEHQIWLLRNVFWWYLLPLGLPILAFFVQVTLQIPSPAWLKAVFLSILVGFVVAVFGWIYGLNQAAVRGTLQQRRQELEALRASLENEAPSEKAP